MIALQVNNLIIIPGERDRAALRDAMPWGGPSLETQVLGAASQGTAAQEGPPLFI
jgi:hypothetical protein